MQVCDSANSHCCVLSKEYIDVVKKLPTWDEDYISLLDLRVWRFVADRILRSKTFNPKPEFLDVMRGYFLKSRTPNVVDLCADEEITWLAPGNSRSRSDLRSFLYKTGYADKKTKLFKEEFIEEYLADAAIYWNEQEDKISVEEDTDYLRAGSYQVSRSMNMDDFTKFLKADPDIVFKIPAYSNSTRWLDFTDSNLQFVEFSNYLNSLQMYMRYVYVYKCKNNECKPKTYYMEVQNLKCPTCGGMMKCYHDDAAFHRFYVTSVLYEDNPLTLFSLSKLPKGDITCAVIIQQRVDNGEYYGYVLGVKETVYASEEARFDTCQHVAFGLADYMCEYQLSLVGTTVRGMDWPKVGVIMCGFANDFGKKSFNYLIVGDAGTGKSKTVCMFTHTMSKNSRLQDTNSTTQSGIVGSSTDLKLGSSRARIHQPGMLSTYKFLGLDEMYANKKVYPDIKNSADAEYVNKCNAVANFETRKTATIFGTANIDPLHMEHIRRLEAELTRKAMNEDDFCEYGKDFRKLWDMYSDDKTRLVEEACIAYEKNRGVCWIDGVESPLLDRFPIIFYIRENENDESDNVFTNSGDDMPYNTIEINEAIYSPAVQELLQERAKIKPTIPNEILPLLSVVYVQLKVHDKVHSQKRLKGNIELLVKMSAALNGRDTVNLLDVLFVKYLLLHTCRRLEQSDMKRESIWNGYLEDEQILELIHAPYTGVMYSYSNERSSSAFDTAPSYVKAAEAKQAKEKIVTDQSVDIISYGYTTDYMKVFQDAPTDATKPVMVSYLMDLFMNVKTVKQSALDVFAESYGEDKSIVIGSIDYLKDELKFIEHNNGIMKLK